MELRLSLRDVITTHFWALWTSWQRSTTKAENDDFTEIAAKVQELGWEECECEEYTHKYSTYRVAQHDQISSREHAWLKLQSSGLHIFVYPKTNDGHPRAMSHSLPHLTLTTSTRSLSPISSTSPMFPTVSPSQTSPTILNPYLPSDVPRQSGGSTQIPPLPVRGCPGAGWKKRRTKTRDEGCLSD